MYKHTLSSPYLCLGYCRAITFVYVLTNIDTYFHDAYWYESELTWFIFYKSLFIDEFKNNNEMKFIIYFINLIFDKYDSDAADWLAGVCIPTNSIKTLTCRSLEWIQQCYMNRFKIFIQICTRQHTFNKTDCDLSILINYLT